MAGSDITKPHPAKPDGVIPNSLSRLRHDDATQVYARLVAASLSLNSEREVIRLERHGVIQMQGEIDLLVAVGVAVDIAVLGALHIAQFAGMA